IILSSSAETFLGLLVAIFEKSTLIMLLHIVAVSSNGWNIRSFSGTKWKKNLGEERAEPQTVYPLVMSPDG
ncbi:MAG: hypothetical protein U9Q97_05205, partial [Acidobacteriota bacterium]|nr:hypothetical protein [Acidobacteriota bacterium]